MAQTNGHGSGADARGGGKLLILDYGSQYTHLIAQRIRQLNVLSLCISGTSPLSAIAADSPPKAIILSGGPHSVHLPDSPCFPDDFLRYVQEHGVPVLGICYGMQLLVQKLGGEVTKGEKQEYGKMEIKVETSDSALYHADEVGTHQIVWMSHGDEAVRLPEGFEVVARSTQGTVAAIEDRKRQFYGLQYHPEVTHSSEGMETLCRFLFGVCGFTADWKMQDVLEDQLNIIQSKVGPNDLVICGLSGGVDSTVAAPLVHKAIGDRLHCVFVDTGLLRRENG